jgi:tRNA(Ile)-lysidine synthetase-like protein
VLETFNPRVKESLARASESIVEDDDYLRAAARGHLAASHEESGLNVKALENAPAAIRRRVLRLWLRGERGNLRRISASHIAAIESLFSGSGGRRVELPEGGVVAREFDSLRFIRVGRPGELENALEPIELRENETRNFGGFTFLMKRGMTRADLNSGENGSHEEFTALLRECGELDGLRLRTRFPGAAYIPAGARRAVKVKTLMIKRKIPLTQRDRDPIVVTDDNRIVWAPGLPVARQFAPGVEDEKCALIVAERSCKISAKTSD